MRIIAGRLGGRIFDSPHGHVTHPMADRVRGALFNALGDITGLTILDAFAGSGAVAFEALSRGAKEATLIDNDKSAQRTIRGNIKVLGLQSSAHLIAAGTGSWLETTSQTARFDIIVADPPYDHLQLSLIGRLTARLTPAGTFVLSWPGRTDPSALAGLQLIIRKSYGDAQLLFYQASDL